MEYIIEAEWSQTRVPDGRVDCQGRTSAEWGFRILKAPDLTARGPFIFRYKVHPTWAKKAAKCVAGTLLHSLSQPLVMDQVVVEPVLDESAMPY